MKKTKASWPTFSFPFFNKYFRALSKGKLAKYSKKEINKIIDKYFFSDDPITELSGIEMKNLRKKIFDDLANLWTDSFLTDLAGQNIIYLSPEEVKNLNQALGKSYGALSYGKKIIINFSQRNDIAIYRKETGVRLMTPKEKIDFLKTLPTLLNTRLVFSNCEGSCTQMGYYEIGYYGLDETMALIKETREKTGKKIISVLDLGGGVGLPLMGLKEVDLDIFTINLTLTTEPTMFKVDQTILTPAERFPKILAEKVDVIISNMAFRYFRYPDLAVKNVVRALSIGGIAKIFVASERSDTPQAELKKRLTDTYFWLQDLIKKGIISVEFRYGGPFGDPLEVGETLYPCRGLTIRKLKPF